MLNHVASWSLQPPNTTNPGLGNLSSPGFGPNANSNFSANANSDALSIIINDGQFVGSGNVGSGSGAWVREFNWNKRGKRTLNERLLEMRWPDGLGAPFDGLPAFARAHDGVCDGGLLLARREPWPAPELRVVAAG